MAPTAISDSISSSGLYETTSTHAYNDSLSSGQDDILYGWPKFIAPRQAWTGAQLDKDETYIVALTKEHVEEIEVALAAFHASGCDGSEVNMANFPLPKLAACLRDLAEEVHHGRGFFVLRGLNSARYSEEDNALLFLGISSYIGDIRGVQNADKEVFTHVREAKKMQCSQHDRPLKDSRLALTFHTDSFCDILAMQTRACPAKGGRHILASTANVYNKLAFTRPDVVVTLARPDWHFDSRSPHAVAGQHSLMFYHDGQIMLHFVREPLVGLGPDTRFQVQSTVTPEQTEALDAIELVARHDQLTLSLQPGDLTFVNNLNVIHSREAWDEEDGIPSRYMVRLWLKNSSLAWKLPSALHRGNMAVFDVAEHDLQWNVLPAPRTSFKVQELFGP